MKTVLLSMIGFLAVSAATASAQVTFTLSNVVFDVNGVSAGSLSGTFTANNALTALTSWNITATSTSGSALAHNFAGFTYLPSDSSVSYNVGGGGLTSGFELDSPVGTTSANDSDAVRFYFSTPLSASAPVSLAANSYESEHASGGNRVVASGSVVSAPEPTSYALLAGLVAVLGLWTRFGSVGPIRTSNAA